MAPVAWYPLLSASDLRRSEWRALCTHSALCEDLLLRELSVERLREQSVLWLHCRRLEVEAFGPEWHHYNSHGGLHEPLMSLFHGLSRYRWGFMLEQTIGGARDLSVSESSSLSVTRLNSTTLLVRAVFSRFGRRHTNKRQTGMSSVRQFLLRRALDMIFDPAAHMPSLTVSSLKHPGPARLDECVLAPNVDLTLRSDLDACWKFHVITRC